MSVTISDRSRAIAALEADRAELFIESAGYTQRMTYENHRHLGEIRHLAAIQMGVAEKLAANEAAIDKLMGEV
jgi:hypothetical protein